ncbi:OLC1v1035124C1 [Oldenlandia corymbosa var. corymbosa]|uniref:OLC1v1035124C1 n=1 Tax=Oldenlandia corymbosa var. corymbosa TaxID=529605 RepID=A0AAV1CVB8_OLDCO|nr:OLC1v1035124C1 [Oldenlandia corymbosa var. corymbosa]
MKRKPRAPKPKPFLATLSAKSGPTLIKYLASCNASVRSQTLNLIQDWLLQSEAQVAEDDMMKLWKGLFYCLWHADKAPAQGSLVDRLSSLLVSLDPVISLQYFSFFFVTLRREWTGIDRLRLDKFYLLVRRFVNCFFGLMRKHKWDLEYMGRFFEVLEDKALLANDNLLGNGVNYQVVSVFLDELKGFKVPLNRKEVVECLFRPFFRVMEKSLDKILVGKVKSFVFDSLLDKGKTLLKQRKNGDDGQEGGDGDLLLGIIALKMEFSGRFYELGSSPDIVQGNRKVVLGLHEDFLKLERQLEASGVDIEIPDVSEIDEIDGEEVPQLIPLHTDGKNEVDMVHDAEAVNQEKGNVKKKKKGKKAGVEQGKKRKKNKNGVIENGNVGGSANFTLGSDTYLENGNAVSSNGHETSNGVKDDENMLDLSESVMSNLQAEFEKVAAAGSGEASDDLPLLKMKKKRKRANKPKDLEVSTRDEDGQDTGAQNSSKSAKKVRFAMKNNLVWKPHSPLPPQDLRIPPSVTPRGSALKKGVPPGPIREMPPATKKMKKKKGRKILKTISPAVKRLRRVKPLL